MSEKEISSNNLTGLNEEEVLKLRNQFGKNIFHKESENRLLKIIWEIIKEPMFLLLAIACTLYFILGEFGEGTMMLVAMAFVAAISVYQEIKSSNALEQLKQFSEPKVKVIRSGKENIIDAEELVPQDIMLLDEGMNIPADGIVLQQNDLTINESVITGESLPVSKNQNESENLLYQGTTINSGKCIAKVTATGNETTLGKLGKAIESYHAPKTLLQVQINNFVRRFALIGLFVFVLIFLFNYLHYHEWVASLLFALTLAMSIAPEEIPVAFSSFMALGAYKMSRLGIISRQPQVIENLGAVSVLCFDKTGTITENRMQVKTIYDQRNNTLIDIDNNVALPGNKLLLYAALASETDPFDAMEKAIWKAYNDNDEDAFHKQLKMIHEYPLEGQPPMMTHVYQHKNGSCVIAAKGAAERIIKICGNLTEEDRKNITVHIKTLASKGYRVLGVASSDHPCEKFPEQQDNFDWNFEGLISLFDPPRKNISFAIQKFYRAKIQLKILTGDHPGTAVNIAGQVGIENHTNFITGDDVIKMNAEELRTVVKDTNIFARMFPDAKLKVIDALKANGEIVAMTGDGVNDGPAMKSASIGIAMGQKGTEIAKQAADLILTDDDPDKIVLAISEGRKIFNNLKKAIRYIISIHIPIILTASLPLLFGWQFPNIFTPIHIIFLELIMGPTCSIFFEREPVEENIMQQFPRKRYAWLFSKKELMISILQGIMISAAVLSLYYYFMNTNASLEQTRTIVFSVLILSNVFLTFANRSFKESIYRTSKYKNTLAPFIIIISAAFLLSIYFIPFIRNLFQLTSINSYQFLLCLIASFIGVMWFEVYKISLRLKK